MTKEEFWEEFNNQNDKIAIYCETIEEIKELSNMMDSRNIRPYYGGSFYKKCIELNKSYYVFNTIGNDLFCDKREWYENHFYIIFNFKDIFKNGIQTELL